ncbi:hypothetical protein GOBAR_DD03863 [Gossypium barbadense]|nr:hypothetical protein GOBAR_DD03863 [Gossypium barbadense]
MAEKKWILILSLTFIIAVSQVHHLYMGELASIMLEKLQQWRKPFNNGGKNLAIGPNLTACHSSYGRPDLLVYCCPPGFQTPVPFTDFKFPDPSPVRVRRPAHLLNESFIAKYNKALSIMKSLPYDDPRSFLRQANLHCQFCTGAYEMLNRSGSELNIHRTWMFFPWHRMMIYFHERILGSLIGDDTFALPFWAWDIPDGMTIPDFYVDESSPFFHSQRDFSHFPPRVADLDYSTDDNDPRFDGKEQTETNLAFMYNRMVSGAKKTELFMGCTYKAGDKNCDSPGTIESAPHNTLHTWIGSGLNPGREDMGKFYSAAKDPVFYAHHSNIDQVDRPWLNHRPPPSVPPEQARRIIKLKQNENPVFSSDFRRVLDGKLTVTVNRSVKREKVDEEETVVVYGIVVRGNEYVKFDVYVNLSDDTKMNPKFREFAGTFAYIPGGGRGGHDLKKMKLKLGISELLKDLKADEDESIWVTFVPRTTSCSNVSIEGIKIEYIK